MGVLMTCPMHSYIQEQLAKRFNLFKLWHFPSFVAFAQAHGTSVRAVVASVKVGVDATTIDSLPNLQIVSTYSVGYDNIDLRKCREKGIPVTNTPDVLTDDVADLAIALALSLFCTISHSPRRNSAPHLTPKVFHSPILSVIFFLFCLIIVHLIQGLGFTKSVIKLNLIL